MADPAGANRQLMMRHWNWLWRSLAILAAGSLLYMAVVAETSGKLSGKRTDIHALPRINLPDGPEPLLAKVFSSIEQNQVDLALRQAETLVAAYPNFRLAYLIKGDLLLARTQPLNNFGQGGGAAARNKVNDLREEAIARLKGYRSKPAPDEIPRYLLQMPPGQKYAVVVDTQKSRLYLYQNDQGIPRFAADYYITQGKLGAEKSREGDKKTPIGVYHVTASLPPQKLDDFYGNGAFPINYPNEWDKRQGRNGHGIWLHGTPSNTYSRPPKASDGCVVLTNQDLNSLAQYLQIGLTPVIISNTVEWRLLDDWRHERDALRAAMDEWRHDWESRDIIRYARHYSRKFKSDGQDYVAWVEQKRRINASKNWVNIAIDDVGMYLSPGKEEYAVVTFDQDYRSNNLSGRTKKRQYWIKEDGRWKIVAEGSA